MLLVSTTFKNALNNLNTVNNIYPDGQSVSSSLRVAPFAVLFWALSIVLAHILQQVTQPAGLASLKRGTDTALYGRGQLGST